MGMNSFSFRKELQEQRQFEEAVSGLVDLHQDGETFQANCFEQLRNMKFEPVNLDQLKKSGWSDAGFNRRFAPRYELKLTVLVCNYRKAFRTRSLNISFSGMLIKDLLPIEFSKHFFDVVLIQELGPHIKNYFLLRGRAVEGPMRSARVIFQAMAPDVENRLQSLLATSRPIA